MAMRTEDPRALAGSIEQVRALRREILRREILQQRRIDLLATDVLGYELRPFHAAMLAFQEAAADIALQLAPRGYGKSTVLTIARAVYEVLRNPNIRILIASNTQHQAEVFLREIKFHLALNEKVIDAFGRFQDEGKWDAREILVKPRRSSAKEATVTCVGVGGPVASRHYDLILADDLVDEENARTEGQREKVRTWYYKTLLPCLEPDGRLFIVGTRYHYLDRVRKWRFEHPTPRRPVRPRSYRLLADRGACHPTARFERRGALGAAEEHGSAAALLRHLVRVRGKLTDDATARQRFGGGRRSAGWRTRPNSTRTP
jgi:hypothetical protein